MPILSVHPSVPEIDNAVVDLFYSIFSVYKFDLDSGYQCQIQKKLQVPHGKTYIRFIFRVGNSYYQIKLYNELKSLQFFFINLLTCCNVTCNRIIYFRFLFVVTDFVDICRKLLSKVIGILYCILLHI